MRFYLYKTKSVGIIVGRDNNDVISYLADFNWPTKNYRFKQEGLDIEQFNHEDSVIIKYFESTIFNNNILTEADSIEELTEWLLAQYFEYFI